MLKSISTLSLALSLLLSGAANAQSPSCDDFTNVEMRKLRSDESINFCQFKDKPLLIVNTASNCGYTGQFEGLEKLHQKYKDQGLVVLGFPSDDFFQEEDDEKETAKVCFINYGVTFDMFATTAVRGSDANPLFEHLNEVTSSPNWNFYKYLVSADRKTIKRFNSRTKPMSEELTSEIEKLLPR
ncbi:glutathione peroxidase [Pseudoalteromonas sp. McH1-7]|uniref:Glutathione peroxidase n=1 Tax=Pseudoalteromonas peptidolytica F12-50-A1 TaxID=1315280 RepID=A0A8I0MYL0_9GAMM|nr:MULTISPECIES: glutathione peroxidase [Pseudoalteromonas]MBE0347399.1 glutathione peroxidase [Pseudoalteromonas peptidolytica F12-50-A1]MDW7549500.1 glutathione peroxidase [Pseudoalteromonas peptidolytica]NLR13164.1 glutathione peroxidase [Pseudoalteromonas peptidolytica]NUZ10603.1 glutathione peroxidase [Pseudoalteromonas sp. McH1-7]RRS10678.1 glutathione peroxidase [Pseudoalteromonas sp. J010]